MNSIIKILIISPLMFGIWACSNPVENEENPKEEEHETTIEIDPNKIKRIGNGREGYRFTNEKGDTLFDGRAFAMASEFKYGYSSVVEKKDGKRLYGVINYKGEDVIPIEHSDGFISPAQKGGYFIISKGGKFGLIDSTANMVIPMEYRGVLGGLEEKQVRVKNEEGKWGSVSASNETVIPLKYEMLFPWTEGRILAQISKNKYEFLDAEGKSIHEGTFELARSFKQGIALVKKNGKIGFINTDGEVTIDFQFDEYKTIVDAEVNDPMQERAKNYRFILEEGYIILKKGGKWGYIDKSGKEIVPFEFDDISILQEGSDRVGIVKNGKQGVYSIKDQKLTMKN